MSSKLFAVFGVLVVLSMLLGACAAPAPQVAAPAPQVVEKVVTQVVEKEVQVTAAPKTQVVYNTYQSDPEPRKADEELVKQFMEMNPNIEVTQSTVAHEDFKQAIRAYLTSSTPPDVMTWFAGNRARFFIDKGVIMDISDVWEKEGWNNSYPKGFKALSTVDGKQYFVPTSYYWWALYFNKTVLEKYGIEPPKTFDELLAACDTLNENGVAPIAIGSKAPWTLAGWFDYLNMRTNGPEFHINLMLGKEKYDDPRVKKTFENWKALLDRKCFMPDAASYAVAGSRPHHGAGQGRHVPDGPVRHGLDPQGEPEGLRLRPLPDHRPEYAHRRGRADRWFLCGREGPAS